MRRDAPLRRIAGVLALALLVAAQPQLVCGLHCLMMSRLAPPMDAAMGHHAHPAADQASHHATGATSGVLCHAGSLTSQQSVPLGRVAVAWLHARAGADVFATVRAFAPADAPARLLSILPEPTSPPPRG